MKRVVKGLNLVWLLLWGNAALAQGVIATAYSGDNFSGQAFAIPAAGSYAMDTSCGPVLGLSSAKTLGFRPRSIQVADGYEVRIQGWHANAGDDHCKGPSFSRVPPTCLNSKNLYDPGCVNSWVYSNVGGAVIIVKVATPQTDPSVIATAYSGDGFTGKAVAIRGVGTYAMDAECGPVLGLSSANVLGFRPRSLKLAHGYQARLQGWHGNPGDTHCQGPSASTVSPACIDPKNLYDPGCLNPWVYSNVGGALIIEKVPTPQTDPSVIATAYSGDNFSGHAVAIRARGVFAMDAECGPVLGLGSANVLGFRPRSLKLAHGYQARLQGWHGNPGDTHCQGPSASTVSPVCVDPKNLYDPDCLSPWVYNNVGGALVID